VVPAGPDLGDPGLMVQIGQMIPMRPGARITGIMDLMVRKTSNEGVPSFDSNR
jgi:hypothetical protein